MVLRSIAALLGVLGLIVVIVCGAMLAKGDSHGGQALTYFSLGSITFILAAINETLTARLPGR